MTRHLRDLSLWQLDGALHAEMLWQACHLSVRQRQHISGEERVGYFQGGNADTAVAAQAMRIVGGVKEQQLNTCALQYCIVVQISIVKGLVEKRWKY